MNKSYKMVQLKYILSRGPRDWFKPVSSVEGAPFFHSFLMEKEYRFKADFSDAKGKGLRDYDEKKMSDLIADMPMTKWSGSAKESLIVFDGRDSFSINLAPADEEFELLYRWTEEIAEYRHHAYFERKAVL